MKNKTIWVIVREVNDYSQHGSYFVTAFKDKPTKEQLDDLGFNGEHLLKGGGRVDYEFDWYYLLEVGEGEMYSD